jgi:hypothetical protein
MQMLQPVSHTDLNYVASVSFSRRKMNQTIALILSIIKRAQLTLMLTYLIILLNVKRLRLEFL